MAHPPYHLKTNKAIDRLLLVDILDVLKMNYGLSDYTYYGFGGPYLEDCRIIHDWCPEIQIVSIENDEQTFKRQEFHRFTKKLELRYEDFSDFLLNFSSIGREIIWLDYIDREYKRFNEFQDILGKVSENSVVKITIRAERDKQNLTTFEKEYPKILPPLTPQPDIYKALGLAKLLQDMLQIAAQRGLPASGESVFQLLNSSYYKDSSQMLSVTGIVCNKKKKLEVQEWFKDWKFANLKWECPHKIDVPILSIKERLHLEQHMPTKDRTGQTLSDALGYKIDISNEHIEKMKQYEEYYQYYPYFMRALI